MINIPLKLFSVFTFLLYSTIDAGAQQNTKDAISAELIKVIDGSHIVVRITPDNNHNGNLTIKLLGIDTPSLTGACLPERLLAQKAKKKLESILRRDLVLFEFFEIENHSSFIAQVKTIEGADPVSHLVAENLARPYWGGHLFGWCEDQTTCETQTCSHYDQSTERRVKPDAGFTRHPQLFEY